MNFVSESALEEKRRLRQEEWERVRKPDDPIGMILNLLAIALMKSFS